MSDPKRHRGEFVPCSECDRPQLCAVLKPKKQPCWKEPAPPGTAWRRLSDEPPPEGAEVLCCRRRTWGYEYFLGDYDGGEGRGWVRVYDFSDGTETVLPAAHAAHLWWHPLPDGPAEAEVYLSGWAEEARERERALRDDLTEAIGHLAALVDLYRNGYPESDHAARLVSAAETYLESPSREQDVPSALATPTDRRER